MRLRLKTLDNNIYEAFASKGVDASLHRRITEIASHVVIDGVFYKFRKPLVECYFYEGDRIEIREKVLSKCSGCYEHYSYKKIDDMEFLIVDGSKITQLDIDENKYLAKNIIII